MARLNWNDIKILAYNRYEEILKMLSVIKLDWFVYVEYQALRV